MRENKVFDFLGADFFAAAVDEVFLPSLHDIIAGFVPPHQVTGAVKSIRRERASIVFRNAEVTPQCIWAAAAKLADFPAEDFAIVIVKNPHFVIGTYRTAYRFLANV